MQHNHSIRWLISFIAILCKYEMDDTREKQYLSMVLVVGLSMIEGKGYSGGRGSTSFKGGSRGSGTFGGSSNYNRGGNIGRS